MTAIEAHQEERGALLITGGCGFIGSHFLMHILARNPERKIVNLDKMTYAASTDTNRAAAQYSNYRFVKGSIENKELVEHLFREHDIRGVIHFAAESHVDNSIANPEVFVWTNVLGTQTLLNAALSHWMESPGQPKPGHAECRFHHISTDEVYGALGPTGKFTEESKYAPNSPYSASKAGSDLLVSSYNRTYGLNTVITNCSNNYGPGQHAEKLIPTVIRSALAREPIPIYGTGQNVRDWLHVQDHAEAIELVFRQGTSGETYNIGSDNEWSNLELVKRICSILDELEAATLNQAGLSSFAELIHFTDDRPGHDWRYAIDSSKLYDELGWQARIPFAEGLRGTIEWYSEKLNHNS
ncbi:dTDP-glucose 4,6-dehydratase [Paenibacillus senegalimassiliensis]|uniref:dTDP-glucose 4,6-dehydratase n=1 Tax=Paenibacillus senegalimassiliensis TaxID=1737426 RepID=UPI00073F1664|nr:dTDP-glucose 4,6-dehydratase [Paenibacillus senegalimassiliensis]